MKINLNIVMIAIPISSVAILAFIASINKAGTDTKNYIEFASYTQLHMNGIETFYGYPGEYTLTILNKLSGFFAKIIFQTNDSSFILAIAK
jgi:hypothetical protein